MVNRTSSNDLNFVSINEEKLKKPQPDGRKRKSTVKQSTQKNRWFYSHSFGRSLATKAKPHNTMGKKTSSISIYRKIAITFVVLTIALALVVVYFSVVSVKIVIIPNKERTTAEFNATVIDKAHTQAVQSVSLTGLVESADVDVSQTFQTTGREVQASNVGGLVTLYNNRTTEQLLVATTRLLSPDGRLYRIQATVRVPARGTTANVSVRADQPDKSMEIGPTKFTIPGLNQASQELVYAESSESFTYQETGDAVVSAADIANARDTLKKALLEKVAAISQSGAYQGYDHIIYDADEDKITYDADVLVGEKIAAFSMSARAQAAVVAFNTADIAALAKLKVEENLPDDKQLQSFDESNFQFTIERYNTDSGLADLAVAANAQMILKSGTDIIDPERLVGLSREQLDDYLSSLREVAGYEVKFTPNWIKQVPSLVDHIKVEVAK